MSDAGILDCCSCVCMSLQVWSTTLYGDDACCYCWGCCDCCDSSFNEDNFDERLKKEQAKNGANTQSVDSQPVPSQDMSATTGDPRPTDASA